MSADGALTEVPGSPFGTASNPQSVAFSPSGALLATADYGAGGVSVFSVGAGGALTEVPGSPFSVGSAPQSIAFSPNGALLAIQSFNSNSVSVYSVSANGALAPVAGSPFSVGSLTGAIAFSPSGALLAVAPSATSMAGVTPTDSVTMFSVGACGALTQVAGSPFPTEGTETTAIAFSPSGTLLATDNYGSHTISLFSVAASGALTQVPDSPFVPGLPVSSLAFSPDSALLATANTDYSGVSVFSIGSSEPAATAPATTCPTAPSAPTAPSTPTTPSTPTAPSTPITPTPPSAPAVAAISSNQITAALRAIAHPSGNRTIGALVRTGVFKTHFDAPVGGSLSVVWTTTVTSGEGKHRKRRTITVARGVATANSATRINLVLHLTATGRILLKKHTLGVPITATEDFRPYVSVPTSVRKTFSL